VVTRDRQSRSEEGKVGKEEDIMSKRSTSLRRSLACFSFLALAAFCGCGDDEVAVIDLSVHFADANLEAAVRAAIQKPTGLIYPFDLTGLQTLSAPGADIRLLGGIQYCVNLNDLDLHDNLIVDLSPLAGLVNLTVLDLGSNSIVGVGALAALIKLTSLRLGDNTVETISALGTLTNLLLLELQGNHIEDIGPLATLTDLTLLRLDQNRAIDLTALEGLKDLTTLQLQSNNIVDISALVNNCIDGGLGNGDSVFLEQNPLSQQALLVDIPFLHSREVNVTF
jgi:Leucine-rich repeat (LRR) protein